MKATVITIVVAAVLLLLALTNPDSEGYGDHLRDQATEGVDENDELSKAVAGFAGGFVSGVLSAATERQNFGLFSVFTTDLGTSKTVTLGILGNFVVLQEE